jgi:hypothetical protein
MDIAAVKLAGILVRNVDLDLCVTLAGKCISNTQKDLRF